MYKVATGNEEVTQETYSYSQQILKELGKNSVFAKKGVDLINNEYVVFDDAASKLEYIVMFKCKEAY